MKTSLFFLAIFLMLIMNSFSQTSQSLKYSPYIILSDVPDVRQCSDYSCGASVLQAILFYWGMEFREMSLMEMLHTTPDNGTHPSEIIKVSKSLGLKAEIKENITIADLEKSIQKGIPVIICCQAWREEEDLNKPWKEVWESGHYMIVIGYDEQNLYFEDPSILGSRGIIPKAEFMDRWHDYEGDVPLDFSDYKYVQTGIFIQGEKSIILPQFLYVE